METGPYIPVYRVLSQGSEKVEVLFDPAQFFALVKVLSNVIGEFERQTNNVVLQVNDLARLLIDEDPQRADAAFSRYCEMCAAAGKGRDAWTAKPEDFHADARRLVAKIFFVDAQLTPKNAKGLSGLFRLVLSLAETLEQEAAKRQKKGGKSSGGFLAGLLAPFRSKAAKAPYADVGSGTCYVVRGRLMRLLEYCHKSRDEGICYRFDEPENRISDEEDLGALKLSVDRRGKVHFGG